MITQYFWPAPNGYKPLLLLVDTGEPYRIEPVDVFIACYPWARLHDVVQVSLNACQKLLNWAARISKRSVAIQAYACGEPFKVDQELDDNARRILFGQGLADDYG